MTPSDLLNDKDLIGMRIGDGADELVKSDISSVLLRYMDLPSTNNVVFIECDKPDDSFESIIKKLRIIKQTIADPLILDGKFALVSVNNKTILNISYHNKKQQWN